MADEINTQDSQWQKGVIEKLATSSLNEQRRLGVGVLSLKY